MYYTWCIERTESVHPEEKKAKKDSNCFFPLWWIFKEHAARLLIVLYNERRDIWHNLQERMFKAEKNGGGKKINEGCEALEEVHQRYCRGTKMWLDLLQSDLT